MKLVARGNSKGFTLVELLIVVAIIGVLSTIGVPTFRKMIQKAKKSEAKVALGALYTVESAFMSEYSTYGNNLASVGYQLDGSTQIYTTGFTKADCTALIGAASPATSTTVGTALNSAFSSYYVAANLVERYVATPTAPATCVLSVFDTAAGATFTASSSGVISPSTSAAVVPDEWTITDKRVLTNSQDGVY